ncbi:integrase arm-type DNA-binding domain-containing protein [Novosphingobium sp. EMRT-2]|uniref:tyrosine-type recombinase/integrase n=1 Tax=Novosphingobium sp. EMRT-2 TaxID=2571749 RepID=UPI0010BDB660|nr:integrase arm-type DNA-binding domain-containing protein [Novosphingobium sp. EMRT-2]QCI93387.1 DUF4102 domain-containing protein [Novosphingobium sp. EMRT-2]
MPLTDTAVRNAKPREKAFKLGDSGGLYLQVTPTGAKLWRLKYRVHGKEKKLAIGVYPEISLADARAKRDAAKAELASGKDPSREKQRRAIIAKADAGNTFALIASEFIAHKRRDGNRAWAPKTADKNEWLIGLLTPSLGSIPIADIEPAEVLHAVRKIEARGAIESARRALQLAGGVFRYAVATTRLRSDPTRDLKGALLSPDVKHRAAILDPKKLGELLRAIDGYNGHYTTKFALELAPHVFVRPGELRHAEWPEIDFDKSVWAIPAARMKMRKPHHVPLSRQALEIFRRLYAVRVSEGYIFPSIRTHKRPMSENTLNAALRRLGFGSDEVSAHGFRATASTLLNEAQDAKTGQPLWSANAIERALAHGDEDKVRAAYHRGQHWPERVKMAQWWSDYLDTLRTGAEIVPFPEREAG